MEEIVCSICDAILTKYNESDSMILCKHCKEDIDKEQIYDDYLNNNN